MEETIKGIEVIAYKGMEFDITCKGFHYELGKTYKTDSVELCNDVFIKIDKTGKFIKNCSRIWEKLLKICNRIWKRFI